MLNGFRFVRLAASLAVVLYSLSTTPAECADRDFLFLETERALREEPSSPKTPSRLFAVGEYLFDMKHFTEAEGFFRRVEQTPPSSAQGIVTAVYLAQIHSADAENAALGALKNILASGKFFTMSGKTKKQKWESPLKNRYEIEEFVDRLEIRLNGSVFYVVRLP